MPNVGTELQTEVTLSATGLQYVCSHATETASQHYGADIMGAIASQITSLTVVYLDADQRKHQSSTSLAFVREIHRDRWIPRTNGQ